jgi:hypothetical protein
VNNSTLKTYYPTGGGTYGPYPLVKGDYYIRIYRSSGYGGYTLTTITPSLIPKTITITSPNGGENWIVGSNQIITWTSSGTVGNVRIEYSTNNGASWSTVIGSTANDGSHPGLSEKLCKLPW